jgi:hypothetical protein
MLDLELMLQVIACGTTLAATYLIGNKHVAGPALSVMAALSFAVVNAYAGLWLCAGFSATMALMNARNFICWMKGTA